MEMTTKVSRLIAVFVVFGCSLQLAFAQAPTAPSKRLTLPEARELALKTSGDLELGRLNAEAAEHAYKAQKKDYYPQFALSLDYIRLTKTLGDVFFTGGPQPVPFPVLGQNITFGTVMVAQPLTELITVKAAVQATKADKEIAKSKLSAGARDLQEGVTELYYGLLGTQGMLAAAQLKVQAAESEAKTKNTTKASIALLDAQQALSQATSQVILLSSELNGLVGFDPGTQLELVNPAPPAPPVGSVKEAVSEAIANSHEIRQAKETISKAAAGLKIAKMRYVPSVNVMAGYAYLDGVEIFVEDQFGYAAVMLSYPIWQWGKRADLRNQSRSVLDLAEQNLKVTEGKVAIGAEKAYLAFMGAAESVQVNKSIVDLRNKDQQSVGDPATAAALKTAEVDLVKAELGYAVAHAKLVKAISGTY